MRIIIQCFIVAIIIVFSSCQKEEQIQEAIEIAQPDCFGESAKLRTCEDYHSGENKDCNLVITGSSVIKDMNKEYLPQYCDEFMTKVYNFKNSQEEVIKFLLTRKNYFKGFSTRSPDDNNDCPCETKETMVIELHSDTIDYFFELKITSSSFIQNFRSNNSLSVLVGRFKTVQGGTFNYIYSFNVNLDTLDTTSEDYIFHNSIKLLDSTYKNVFSYQSPHTKFVCYYNKEIGLFGFEDEQGEVWKIVSE